MVSREPGHSLLELVTALVLAGLVCAAMFGTLAGGERLARSHAWRIARDEAVRVSTVVLASELRTIEPSADLRALTGDSVALRGFRGIATVCAPPDAAGDVVVRYRGVREPEPAKDSVLLLRPGTPAVELAGSVPTDDGCVARDGESLLRWTLTEAPPTGTLALLFESGTYQIGDGALRYRSDSGGGSGGRQPITAELFDARASTLRPLGLGTSVAGTAGPGAAELILGVPRESSGGAVVTFRTRIAFLNRRAAAGAGEP